MKRIFLLPAAFLCFLIFSCEKDEPEPHDNCLDSPRCEGCDWNVFRCKVNGVDWCANCESSNPLFGCDPVDCLYYPNSGNISITATGGIRISHSNSVLGFNKLSYIQDVFSDFTSTLDCRDFDMDVFSDNYVELLSLNIIEKIIEGKFNYTAINDCQDTVHITDGYFKLTYRP